MSAGGTALCMPRMPECVPTSGLSTTRNRRLLIEVDLTAVERLQRVNSGLQTFVRSGHNFPTMKPLDSDKKAEKAAPVQAEAAQAAPKAEEKIDFSNVEIEPLFQDFVDFETFSKSDFRAVKIKECEAVKKSKKLLKFVLDDGTGEDRVILSGIHEYYEPEELVGKTCIAITNLPPRPMMRHAALCRSPRKRRGKASSADGRSSHPGRRKAVLSTPGKRIRKPV